MLNTVTLPGVLLLLPLDVYADATLHSRSGDILEDALTKENLLWIYTEGTLVL